MEGSIRWVEPPESGLLMRIISPEFETTAPDIVHAERIPASVAEACAAHRQRVFAPRPVSVWLLRDVFVAGEGLVFDSSGALFGLSVTQHGAADIEWASEQVRAAIRGAAVPQHDVPLVLGKKRGAGNYGHWLMEMLPMLHLVMDRLRGAELGVLLHDVSDPQLGEVIQSSLRRLDIADARVRVSGYWPVRVRSLILVDGLTLHGTYMSPLLRECHARLLHGVVGNGHERVFLARGAGTRRNFTDPAHIEALAQEQGYQVLRPAGATLLEQIASIRDARVVAGAMGAAMTSMAFARLPAQALLFSGEAMPDTFFWFVANLFGHRYREIRCLQAAETEAGLPVYERDLMIGDDEMRRHLADA